MVRSFGGRDSLCYKENIVMVTFENFMKLDIRVGEIIKAEFFEKAKKPAYKYLDAFGFTVQISRNTQ